MYSLKLFFTYSPIFSLPLFLSNCNSHTQIIKRKLILRYPHTYTKTIDSYNNFPPLTIWVHGTRFLPNSMFEKCFNNQSRIKHATEIDSNYHLRMIAETLSDYAPQKFPLDTFYVFAWTGKLNEQKRKYAAKTLYKELTLLIDDYKKQYGIKPHIQLLAHSHGGNVILNMAKIRSAKYNLTIDEVILLATPVQLKTMNLVGNNMFKHIYNLYSSLDVVQIMAPQMRHKKDGSNRYTLKFPPLSDRRFPAHQHIAQAKIKVNGRALFHNEFTKPFFLKLLPHVLEEIKAWHIEGAAQYAQGHDIRQLLCVYTKSKNVKRREHILLAKA